MGKKILAGGYARIRSVAKGLIWRIRITSTGKGLLRGFCGFDGVGGVPSGRWRCIMHRLAFIKAKMDPAFSRG